MLGFAYDPTVGSTAKAGWKDMSASADRRHSGLLALAIMTSLLGATGVGSAELTLIPGSRTTIIEGRCIAEAHIAQGPVGSDLTKRQSRFLCDDVVVTRFKDRPRHILIQFSEKHSIASLPVGFAGTMNPDGEIVAVETLYLTSKDPIPASDGACKFFYKNRKLNGIACGAVVDKDGWRTVADIAFDAKAAP